MYAFPNSPLKGQGDMTSLALWWFRERQGEMHYW